MDWCAVWCCHAGERLNSSSCFCQTLRICCFKFFNVYKYCSVLTGAIHACIHPPTHPSIHPCTALQPLLGPGLPQKTPPFVPIPSSSTLASYSYDLHCIPMDNSLSPCSWLPFQSCILDLSIKNLLLGILSSCVLVM